MPLEGVKRLKKHVMTINKSEKRKGSKKCAWLHIGINPFTPAGSRGGGKIRPLKSGKSIKEWPQTTFLKRWNYKKMCRKGE